MITAVDTNILLDIFSDAPVYADKSARALRKQSAHGSLAAGGVVWAEAATFFAKREAAARLSHCGTRSYSVRLSSHPR
jgi:predicted nucleic acid-binding protein